MYQIVKCERTLKQFLSIFPKLKKGEVFFGALQSRNKYSTAKIADTQVGKFTATNETLFSKIKKLEIGDDLYIDLKSKEPIEPDAFTLYVNMNPRNLEMANLKTAKEINQSLIERHYQTDKKIPNPVSIAYSCIQTTRGTHHITDVDIDVTDKQVLGYKKLLEILDVNVGLLFVRSIIETRGGYHIQINNIRLPEAVRKRWAFNLQNAIKSIDGTKFDFQPDTLTPVAGCIQGDFVPKLIYFSEYGVVFGTGALWNSIDSVIILDPDGFDRKDFEWSYFSELLTYSEYAIKQMMSTCTGNFITKNDPKLLINKLNNLGDKINSIDELTNDSYEGVFEKIVEFKQNKDLNNDLNFKTSL